MATLLKSILIHTQRPLSLSFITTAAGRRIMEVLFSTWELHQGMHLYISFVLLCFCYQDEYNKPGHGFHVDLLCHVLDTGFVSPRVSWLFYPFRFSCLRSVHRNYLGKLTYYLLGLHPLCTRLVCVRYMLYHKTQSFFTLYYSIYSCSTNIMKNQKKHYNNCVQVLCRWTDKRYYEYLLQPSPRLPNWDWGLYWIICPCNLTEQTPKWAFKIAAHFYNAWCLNSWGSGSSLGQQDGMWDAFTILRSLPGQQSFRCFDGTFKIALRTAWPPFARSGSCGKVMWQSPCELSALRFPEPKWPI